MPVRNVKGRSAELQFAFFTAQAESLADRQVFVQLRRLAELRNGTRQVPVNHVGRLNERGLIEVGTRLRPGVPVRVQQWLAQDQTAARTPRAEQILPATDSDGSAALVAVDARDAPVAKNPVQHRVHAAQETLSLPERQFVDIAHRQNVRPVRAVDYLFGKLAV